MIRKTIRFYEVGVDRNPDKTCIVGAVTNAGALMSIPYSKKHNAFNAMDSDTPEEVKETEIKVRYWFRLFL